MGLFLICGIIALVVVIKSKPRQRGKCVFVADGDTIIIENLSKKQFKIRLEHIDAPERNQSYGEESKEFLSSLILGRTVSVIMDKKDKYDRNVGVVFYGRTNVNLALLEAGMAWYTCRYSNEPDFAEMEEKSRQSNNGLWGEHNPTPPWNFRRYKNL